MLFAFLLGACLASFCCVVIERSYQGISIVKPASHCTCCQHKLRSYELIPIFSILLQKFRCTACQQSIPKIYLLAEVSGALLFVGLSQLPLTFCSLFCSLWLLSGWLLSLTDLFYYHVEPKILYPVSVVMLLLAIFGPLPLYWQQTALLFLIFLCIRLFFPHKIGGGDLQLLLCWSLFLPYHELALLICLASLLGVLVILLSNLLGQPIKKLPFVPFLWAALAFLLWHS